MSIKRMNERRKELGWKWWILIFLLPSMFSFILFRDIIKSISSYFSTLVIRTKKLEKLFDRKINKFIERDNS